MNKENRFLLILFLIAVIIRTIYVYKTYSDSGDSNWSDAKLYTFYGKEFAKGNFYPYVAENNQNLLVGPVIPLIYAMSYILMPNNYWPFFIYNILLASGIVILLYFIGKKLLNKSLGYFMAIWGLLFFDYMKYTPTILKEPTICFFLTLFILLTLIYWQNKQNYRILLGIVLSYSILIHTDERYLAFLPIIMVVPFISDTTFKINKTKLFHAVTFLGLTILLLIPWTIRNYKEYGEIVLLTPRTTAITSKFWGTNQSVINFEGDNRAITLMETRKVKANQYATQHGIEPHIQKGFESKWRAFINYWQPTYFRPTFIQYGYRFQKWSMTHNMLGLLSYGIFLPLFILGIVNFIRKRNLLLIWLISIPILHSLIHAYMVWPLERYRMPINFIIVIVAALYISDLIKNNTKWNYFINHFSFSRKRLNSSEILK